MAQTGATAKPMAAAERWAPQMTKTSDPAPPRSGTPGAVLSYPAGSLVLVAGLPGAGKSTLLGRLYPHPRDRRLPVASGDVRMIDSMQARNWWEPRLGPLPRRAGTPLVHATHVLRIAAAVRGGHGVVAHTRGTWPHILYGLAWLVRRRGGGLHMILLDVPPPTAQAGQRARGRMVSPIAFARQCRRWQVIVARARAGELPPAQSVTVLDRSAADLLDRITIG